MQEALESAVDTVKGLLERAEVIAVEAEGGEVCTLLQVHVQQFHLEVNYGAFLPLNFFGIAFEMFLSTAPETFFEAPLPAFL